MTRVLCSRHQNTPWARIQSVSLNVTLLLRVLIRVSGARSQAQVQLAMECVCGDDCYQTGQNFMGRHCSLPPARKRRMVRKAAHSIGLKAFGECTRPKTSGLGQEGDRRRGNSSRREGRCLPLVVNQFKDVNPTLALHIRDGRWLAWSGFQARIYSALIHLTLTLS